VYAEARAAWEATSAAGRPVRIEAASLRGRPVWFQVAGPWSRPEQATAGGSRTSTAGQAVQIALLGVIVLGSILMAHRNLRLGRGDRRGAARLAIFVICLSFASSILHTTHTPTASEVGVVVMAISGALFFGGIAWLLYLALEPFLRRRWPHALIGWGKVLAGRLRDPLVGRDVLIGAAAGVAVFLAHEGVMLVSRAMGDPAPSPGTPGNKLSDITHTFDSILSDFGFGISLALAAAFLLFLIRVVVRKDWVAALAILVIGVAMNALFADGSAVAASVSAAIAFALLLFLVIRFGVLAAVFLVAVSNVIDSAVPAPLGAWYGYAMWAPLTVVAAIAIFAFYTSLAGRPLFREALLET
jgi:hypothetical protein